MRKEPSKIWHRLYRGLSCVIYSFFLAQHDGKTEQFTTEPVAEELGFGYVWPVLICLGSVCA